MRVVIAAEAWRRMCAHLDASAPAEAAGIALVALRQRDEFVPSEMQALEDIEQVTIAKFVPIPLAASVRSEIRVEVLPEANAPVNAAVLAACRRHPRLRAAAYIHSHPFATGWTEPSLGDVTGHMRPLLKRNREAGLEVSFSFIAAREGNGWVLCCFALTDKIVSLGKAEVVDDVSEAFIFPKVKRDVRRWQLPVQVERLFDGWLRIRVGSLIIMRSPRGASWVWIKDEADSFFLRVNDLESVDPLLKRYA